MPWKVQPVKGGFKVFNQETGKTYSKHPQSKAEASAQMRAMYANSKDVHPQHKSHK